MIKLNIIVLSCFSQTIVVTLVVAGMVAAVFAAYAYKLVTATFSTFMFNWYDYTTSIFKSLIRLYIEFKR